jgi:integrase
MAVNVQARGNRHQLRVTHRLMPRAFFATFDIEREARDYGDQLQAMLDRGVVPQELVAAAPKGDDPLLIEVIRGYTKAAPITTSDDALLCHMLPELVGTRISTITYLWVDRYVKDLKLKRSKPIAPSTIRKRVGVLGRVLDWYWRRVTPQDKLPPANPLRLLPRGYSLYSQGEANELAKSDKVAKRDQVRNRRLEPGEESRILAALVGTKRRDRERALDADPAFEMLFRLIVITGMRLREAYRLRIDQVDLERRLIHVDGSKGHRGVIKPRMVPMASELTEALRIWCKGKVGLLFPFWSGTDDDLTKATARLSARFRVLFDYAEVPNMTEHDLRHEATCRWVTMRRKDGGWVFSDVEICRIMGWSSTDMMLTYASLRGEDLAARLH